MNLKQNKGYVGVDVSIAVIILIILVPTVMGILFGIRSSSLTTEIKEEALNIAVNTLETAKSINLTEITDQNILTKYINNNSSIGTIEHTAGEPTAIIKTNTASYILTVEVEDYASTHEGATQNIIKTVEVKVEYKIQNTQDSIDIKTVIN